jgi:hypothetical protein
MGNKLESIKDILKEKNIDNCGNFIKVFGFHSKKYLKKQSFWISFQKVIIFWLYINQN